mmetsp:Transcript_23119/g.50669  ORF Transcript_23119/g.50669 Transcript_23119/m.50669 type:complete len:250 (-) Transcript_23119:3142-3891(-)
MPTLAHHHSAGPSRLLCEGLKPLQIERICDAGVVGWISAHADQRVCLVIEQVLQADHHALKPSARLGRVLVRLGHDVLGHLLDVGVVEGGVHLVEHEEGGGAEAVDGEEQREGGHRLLAARQLLHVAEPLRGGHRRELDPVQERVVLVLQREVGCASEHVAGLDGELLVDGVDVRGDVVEGVHEHLRPLELLGHEELGGLAGVLLGGLELLQEELLLLLDGLVLLHRLEVRRQLLQLQRHVVHLLLELG